MSEGLIIQITAIEACFLKHLLKMDHFLQTSTNVQAILVLMAALVKTRLADTFVSVLQDTREKIVKPVSNYIRTCIQKKARPLYMEGRPDRGYRSAEIKV